MWNVLAQAAEDDADLSVEVAESCADLGPVCDLLVQWTGDEALSSTLAWLPRYPSQGRDHCAGGPLAQSVHEAGHPEVDGSSRLGVRGCK